MYYLDLNKDSSKSIILIHGLGVDSRSWKYQVKDLTDAGIRLIIVDLPGFGRSSLGKECFSIELACEEIFNLIKQLGLKKTSIMGISMGGAISMKMLTMKPEIFSKVIIVNSFAKIEPKTPKEIMYFLGRLIITKILPMKWQSKICSKLLFDDRADLKREFEEQINSVPHHVYSQAVNAIRRVDLKNDLELLEFGRENIMVITGKNDRTIRKNSQEKLAQMLKCKYVVIDGNHALNIVNAKRFNDSVIKFIFGQHICSQC